MLHINVNIASNYFRKNNNTHIDYLFDLKWYIKYILGFTIALKVWNFHGFCCIASHSE